MVDKVASHEEFNSQRRQIRRGHHRQWWNFHAILLALALFPLVYIRHLWNVGYTEIFSCVFIIFTMWFCVGCFGQLYCNRGYSTVSTFQINWKVILLTVLFVTLCAVLFVVLFAVNVLIDAAKS
jgi:hypothetical protein